VKLFFDVIVLINRYCLLGIDDFHVIFTVHFDSISSIMTNKCTFCISVTLLHLG
jgi:hypothetical protein